MGKKITGAEYPLSKIFSSDFDYVIPSYQRPYAWTVDQASELFDDLYDFFLSEEEEGYFLGSIVLIKEDGNPSSEVIDGQQRLTTLTILLAALAMNVDSDEQKTLQEYIIEPGNQFEDLSPKPRLTLRERDREFFHHYVQSLEFDDLLALDSIQLENESQRNIQLNSRLLLDRIGSKFTDRPQDLRDFIGFLMRRCYLVTVSTPSQQSAFRVFSVMNSRGLDLQPTDIIKADTIGNISSALQNEYNDRWEDMEVELGRDGFNDLFAYVRMLYAKNKAKRALLEEFRLHVLPQISSPDVLVSEVLEPYAEALATIKKSNYEAQSHADAVNTKLHWLNRIDNSDWMPPAMLFLSQWANEPEYVAWFFERLERLAAYMHVCARNVNERIERYAVLILGLENKHFPAEPVAEIELDESEKEQMRRALAGDIYLLTARRRKLCDIAFGFVFVR